MYENETIFAIVIILMLIILYIIIEKGKDLTKKIDDLMDNVNKRIDTFFKNK